MSVTDEEKALVDLMVNKIQYYTPLNWEKERYYDGRNRLKDLHISIPPQLTSVDTVVGWPGTTVQVLEERLDFEGYMGPDSLGLNEIFRANELDSESSLGHLDALIYGTGFVVVGSGGPGEANPLITIESPKRMTALYDMRSRRVIAALAIAEPPGNIWDKVGMKYALQEGTLYLPNETVQLKFIDGTPMAEDRDIHNLGRVPVARFINQPRSGDPDGRSEITRAVRSYTDSAMRTLLGAEVAREFYSAPQRYVLGADEENFMDSDGNNLNPWSVIQGRLLALPYNETENVMPQIGQFQANSTTPYFEQVRAYAQMLAAETAIPPSYLGFQTDNPSSADAIRQMEARLVKRAERRQQQFGRTWMEVARLALLVRDGVLPDEIANVRPIWRDASTPTRAAAADEAVKLISAGVLLPDSEITYNRIGLSDSDKEMLKLEKAGQSSSQLIANLALGLTELEAETPAEVIEEI